MLFTKLSSFYFFYFALLGLLAPYLGLYLESKDFSLLEIAQLTSILMVTKVLAPNIWGALADRKQNRLFLVRMGAFSTLVAYLGFFFAEGFWHFAAVIVLFSFFWNAVLPQYEVITLFNLAEYRDKYSRIRLWGSIGFIVSVVVAGWLFQRHGIQWFPWVLLSIVALIAVASMAKLSEPQSLSGNTFSAAVFWKRLRYPHVSLFFVVCFLLQLSHGPYYTYFSIFLESLNYSKIDIGLLWSLGVWAEVLLFVYMHVWFRRSSVNHIMCIALALTALRWLLIAYFADVVAVLILAQCLHAMSFGAMHAAAIHFVHHSFPIENQGRAQALYSSTGFGAGGAAGAYLSGVIVDGHGYQSAFLFSALIAFVAFVLIVLQGRLSVIR